MKRALLLLCLVGCSAGRIAREPRDEIVQLQERIASLRGQPQIAGACEKLAAEICRCAGRICVLAEELRDEPSRRACVQARADCQEAQCK
jgi:hypothetical protein